MVVVVVATDADVDSSILTVSLFTRVDEGDIVGAVVVVVVLKKVQNRLFVVAEQENENVVGVTSVAAGYICLLNAGNDL